MMIDDDTVNIYIGGSADGKRILQILERMMGKLDDIKEDLDTTKADLASIKEAVTRTVTDLQSQVVVLQKTIDDLKAGDALEQTQIDALVGQAEAVKVAADETLAVVTPVV